MKKLFQTAYLPFAALLGGAIALLLRLWLLILGEDARGLLAAGSFPDRMSWVMVAVMMLLLGVGVWKLPRSTKYDHFPVSSNAAIGIIIAACGILISSVTELRTAFDMVGMLSAVLGLIAAVSLGFLAFFRMKGLRPNIVFHGIVCVYFMFHLVSHYRLWSSYPQLQNYAFELLAIVFVMLACYQRTAFDVGRGNPQGYTFFSLAALFFCMAALPGCDNIPFFIGCGIWMAATPCRWLAPRKQTEE